MIPESAIIVLPLPARVLMPNCAIASIGGRYKKAAAIKKVKKLVREAVEEECIETMPWERVSVTAEFYHATNRVRDDDNAMGSLKSAYDGLVEAGLCVDDNPAHMERKIPVFLIDKGSPRVVLTVTRIA